MGAIFRHESHKVKTVSTTCDDLEELNRFVCTQMTYLIDEGYTVDIHYSSCVTSGVTVMRHSAILVGKKQ